MIKEMEAEQEDFEDLLDKVIDRLTSSIRLLNNEVREGRCGPVIVYLDQSEKWI